MAPYFPQSKILSLPCPARPTWSGPLIPLWPHPSPFIHCSSHTSFLAGSCLKTFTPAISSASNYSNLPRNTQGSFSHFFYGFCSDAAFQERFSLIILPKNSLFLSPYPVYLSSWYLLLLDISYIYLITGLLFYFSSRI